MIIGTLAAVVHGEKNSNFEKKKSNFEDIFLANVPMDSLQKFQPIGQL